MTLSNQLPSSGRVVADPEVITLQTLPLGRDSS
jgi:hypothetical protein